MCLFDQLDSNIGLVLMSEGKTIDALEIRLKIRRQLKLNWRFAAIFPAPTRATKQGKSSGTCNLSSHSFLKVSLVVRDGTMGKMTLRLIPRWWSSSGHCSGASALVIEAATADSHRLA